MDRSRGRKSALILAQLDPLPCVERCAKSAPTHVGGYRTRSWPERAVFESWRLPAPSLAGVLLTLMLSLVRLPAAEPQSPGAEVAVVFREGDPESKQIAEHYARRREVPSDQVIGLDLSPGPTITRTDYERQLLRPLRRTLERHGWLSFRSDPPDRRQRRRRDDGPGFGRVDLTDWKVRYVVLCRGVPYRILPDPQYREKRGDQRPELATRNEAAVDSELSLLPASPLGYALAGVIANPVLGQTNRAEIHPGRGLLMVTRLDGPSAAIARGLVDQALEAETNGLWGNAYMDLRGITNGPLSLGDRWIGTAQEVLRGAGFQMLTDTRPATFPPGLPLPQAGAYAGWYDENVSGPFKFQLAEFMPGAIAYHLHSFSGSDIRSPDRRWVGPLLALGATATIGYVDEPYLQFTVDIGAFWALLVRFGFSFGEAAYAAQPVLSWQTTVIGDPLYRPFPQLPGQHLGHRLSALHGQLLEQQSPLIDWSHLHIVNLNLARGHSPAAALAYLESVPGTPQSALLQEKRGELHALTGQLGPAIDAYQLARDLSPPGLARLQRTLVLARTLANHTRHREALALYWQLLEEFPDYPDRPGIYDRMEFLARQLGAPDEETRINERRQAEAGG